jgi:hypothetical protein
MAQIIPPWVVSILAIMAAIAIYTLRPMPWRMRISIILPIVYFAVEYAWFAFVPVSAQIRVDLTRLGLVLIFSSMIGNAMLFYWQWHRTRVKHEQ